MTDSRSQSDLNLLQPLTYPEVGVCSVRDLYVRLERSAGLSHSERRIEFGTGGAARFDTYFNLFSLGKWQRGCGLTDVRLVLEGEGRFELSVSQTPADPPKEDRRPGQRRVSRDTRGQFRTKDPYDRIVNEVVVLERGIPLEIDLSPIRTLPRGGLLFFGLRAMEAGVLTGGGWATRQQSRRTPEIALAITTFRREEAVRRSVRRFEDFVATSALKDHLHLIVVDNGRSSGIEATDHVTPVENENLGGAGGFTRGLIEAKARGASHCLFMDDDAIIQMETLARTWTYLAYARNDATAVVGALSRASEKWMLWENGATFRLVCRRSHADLDLRDPESLVRLEAESAGFPRNFYGGWWFFAFPISHVDHLPFPFFVRGDDVSFSISHRFRMVTLPGVITFQDEDFPDKATPLTGYLDLRSHLAHHLSLPAFDVGALRTLSIAARFFARAMCFCRYETLEALNLAIEDVMEGPDFFADNADLKQRRADLGALTRTEFYAPHQGALPEVTPLSENVRQPLVRLMKYTLNGHLLPFFSFFGRSHVILASERGHLSRVWGASRVTHIDRHDNTTSTAVHSKSKAFRQSLRMARNAWRFLRRYDNLKTEWQAGYKRLTTEDFWVGKLGLSGPSARDEV